MLNSANGAAHASWNHAYAILGARQSEELTRQIREAIQEGIPRIDVSLAFSIGGQSDPLRARANWGSVLIQHLAIARASARAVEPPSSESAQRLDQITKEIVGQLLKIGRAT